MLCLSIIDKSSVGDITHGTTTGNSNACLLPLNSNLAFNQEDINGVCGDYVDFDSIDTLSCQLSVLPFAEVIEVGKHPYRQSVYCVGQKAGVDGSYERDVPFGLGSGEFGIPIFDEIGRCTTDKTCNQCVVCIAGLCPGGHHSEDAHHRAEKKYSFHWIMICYNSFIICSIAVLTCGMSSFMVNSTTSASTSK